MAIVATEVVTVSESNIRFLSYRCQDEQGVWHDYGPIMTSDPNFDADAHKVIVAQRVADALARSETEALLRG